MAVLSGVVGYLGLFVLLAASMTVAARGVGRLVGVPQFRWFDSRPAAVAWWREASIRLAAMAAPWCVSALLFFVQLAAFGSMAPRGGSYVEVLDGPAETAGMRTGDRIVRIGTEAVSTWDELRATVMRQTEPVDIEIDRDGKKQVLRVAPRNGRIGVAAQVVPEKVAIPAALARALPMPWLVVRDVAKNFLAIASEKEPPDFAGPVTMIDETGKAGLGGMFWFLAALASHFGPIMSGVVVFELATQVVFRVTHPESTSSDAKGFRLARVEQALVLSSIAGLLSVPVYLLAQSRAPVTVFLLLWLMPACFALYPLLAIGGRQLWSRSAVVGYVAISLVIPCFLLPVTTMVLFGLKRAIRAEGFRFGWLRSEPPSSAEGLQPMP